MTLFASKRPGSDATPSPAVVVFTTGPTAVLLRRAADDIALSASWVVTGTTQTARAVQYNNAGTWINSTAAFSDAVTNISLTGFASAQPYLWRVKVTAGGVDYFSPSSAGAAIDVVSTTGPSGGQQANAAPWAVTATASESVIWQATRDGADIAGQNGTGTTMTATGTYTAASDAGKLIGFRFSKAGSNTLTTPTVALGTISADPIAAGNVLVKIDPLVALSAGEIGQLMVNGLTYNHPLPNTVTAAADSSGSTLRVGPVADPKGAARTVLYFGADINDTTLYDGKRAHLSHRATAQRLPYNETFWQTASILHEDWSGTADNQTIFEWHDGNDASSLSPFFTFYVVGNQLTISIRYATVANPVPANMIGVTLFTGSAVPNQWHDYVVQGKINPYGGGFVRVWRDGIQIVNYDGPIGYDQPAYADYAVIGYYHWLTGNTFDTAIPTRRMYFAWASLVSDAAGTYTAADLQTHLAVNGG